jgi:predicted CoA-binding protein
MTSKQSVDGFLDQTVIAVAGVSRSGRGFGAMAYRALKSAGYKALAVNPTAALSTASPSIRASPRCRNRPVRSWS